jgi:hypothetical protein
MKFVSSAFFIPSLLLTGSNAFTPFQLAKNEAQLRRSSSSQIEHIPFGFSSRPSQSRFVTFAVRTKEQELHTAERIAGMSRGEIQHIFEDVDADGSGTIDLVELDLLLSKYFDDSAITKEKKLKILKEMDIDGDRQIDAEEFYQWMVLNTESNGSKDASGTKALARRQERLDIAATGGGIPEDLKELLEELGVGAVVQKVTHPLHSAFGRSLYDHFVSCYVLSKLWGNSEVVNNANLFHALYQRGDGMRAVDFNEYRPKLQKRLGKDVEMLLYLFPSAHKSALLPCGLLHADLGEDIEVPNVLIPGEMVTIPKELRPALVEMEVINSHDQNVLENCDPVHNLWSFYQHATVLPLMSEGARKSIIEFKQRALGATCNDIVEWHTRRFADADQDIPALWKEHLAMFQRNGKYVCAERNMKAMADQNGDGEIDWDEFNGFDWESCFV